MELSKDFPTVRVPVVVLFALAWIGWMVTTLAIGWVAMKGLLWLHSLAG